MTLMIIQIHLIRLQHV